MANLKKNKAYTFWDVCPFDSFCARLDRFLPPQSNLCWLLKPIKGINYRFIDISTINPSYHQKNSQLTQVFGATTVVFLVLILVAINGSPKCG